MLKLVWFRKQHDKELDLLLETKKFWDVNDLEDEEEKLQMLKYLRSLRVFVTWYLVFAWVPSSVVILRPILFGVCNDNLFLSQNSACIVLFLIIRENKYSKSGDV